MSILLHLQVVGLCLSSAGGCSGTPSTWLSSDVGNLFSKPLALRLVPVLLPSCLHACRLQCLVNSSPGAGSAPSHSLLCGSGWPRNCSLAGPGTRRTLSLTQLLMIDMASSMQIGGLSARPQRIESASAATKHHRSAHAVNEFLIPTNFRFDSDPDFSCLVQNSEPAAVMPYLVIESDL